MPRPTSRAIVLTCLLAVGVGCLWVGLQRPKGAVEDDPDVTVVPAGTTTEKSLPVTEEVLKPPEALTLNVRVGDRFPLLKSVRQFLKQPSPHGAPTLTQSKLELLLSVSVEEVRPASADKNAGVVRMAVRYHRVRFSQDLPGHELDYDSDTPPAKIPLELQAYHGLKDNGFQFWLGSENQIVETVGFDKFLERCLQGVPVQHRESVTAVVQGTSGTEGVANFIDQSIGILPANLVSEGTSWSTQKKYLQPVPMWIKNQYTLKKLQKETAEVEILGSVEKIANFVDRPTVNADLRDFERPQAGSRAVAVEVRTGHTAGRYLIDRRTGLPRESNVEQTLAMTVYLPGGVEFPQEKTTITTIGYFTPDRTAAVTIGDASAAPGRIQQVSAEK